MPGQPVLLFKEPTPDNNYETILQTKGYDARCVPVLQMVLTNVDPLLHCLLNAQELNLRGVIITSKRSCDSLVTAFENICSTHSSNGERIPALAYWSTIPFFVVGHATGAALREIQFRFQKYGLIAVRILGESSGTGEQLGHFVVEHFRRDIGEGNLLYLTGDKNRDTVASILLQNEIPFQPMQVYETRQRTDLEQLLEEGIASLQNSASQGPWWTVYFAPSTAQFAIPSAQRVLELRSIPSKIATIGPVTTSYIEQILGLSVQATAPKPDPSSLLQAIQAYDHLT